MVDTTRRAVVASFTFAAIAGGTNRAHAQVEDIPSVDETVSFLRRPDAVPILDARIGFLTLTTLNVRLSRGESPPDIFLSNPQKFLGNLGLTQQVATAIENPQSLQAIVDELQSGELDIGSSNDQVLTLVEPMADLFDGAGIAPEAPVVQNAFRALFHAERARLALLGPTDTGLGLCRSFPFDWLCSVFG